MRSKYHIAFYCKDKIGDTNITLPNDITITPKTLDDIKQIIKEQIDTDDNVIILNWQKFDNEVINGVTYL